MLKYTNEKGSAYLTNIFQISNLQKLNQSLIYHN